MSDADFFIGRRFNHRYEIVRLIANFPLGDMYLATSLRDTPPKEIALSLFWNCSEPCYEALKLHFSKPLTHENILTVFEFDRDEASNLLFIAMEAFDGEPLSAVLNGEPLAIPFITRLIEQLCAAVKAAHDCGIIHGGIEPQNILIRDPGGAISLKLMNFGLLTIIEDNEVIDDRAPEVNNYDPHYVSPELIKDQKQDERSDVYALGCLLYAMLSGRPPYYEQNINPLKVLIAKLTEDPMQLSDLNPDISPSLTEVVMKAISAEPLQRYASVDDLLSSFLLATSSNN